MVKQIINPAIGEIEFSEDQIVRFEEGMLGLPTLKEYLLLESPTIAPFFRLQCIEEPNISFLLLDPVNIDSKFRDSVSQWDKEEEHFQADNPDFSLFVVINISADGEEITANMVAPVIINLSKKRGLQLVLLDSPYSVKHNLVISEEEGA
jgi:flagellar assembly factor FliW